VSGSYSFYFFSGWHSFRIGEEDERDNLVVGGEFHIMLWETAGCRHNSGPVVKAEVFPFYDASIRQEGVSEIVRIVGRPFVREDLVRLATCGYFSEFFGIHRVVFQPAKIR